MLPINRTLLPLHENDASLDKIPDSMYYAEMKHIDVTTNHFKCQFIDLSTILNE